MHALDRPLSGVTRVALELGRALQQRDECDLVFLTTYRSGPFQGDAGSEAHYLPGCERVPGLMILGGPLIALGAWRWRLDLVHDPVGVSPFILGRWAGSFKRVVTIHDAIAFRYPEGYSWSNNFLHRYYVPATLRNVDRVITVSEDARADVDRFLGVQPARLSVVPNGVSERFRPIPDGEASQIVQRHGVHPPYILHVGTGQARKNVAALLTAFRRLQDLLPGHELVLAGPSRSRPQTARSVAGLGLAGRVVFLDYVPEDELPALYSAASLFVLPSLYEGFGLPILEAMACGTPVVCSNRASLPEVAGDAALLVDPGDTEVLSRAMYRVLSEPSLRASLRDRGLERARMFSWDRAARGMLEVYREVLETPAVASSVRR